MKLTVTDGERAVVIQDNDTTYTRHTLTEWAHTAALLLDREAHSGELQAHTERAGDDDEPADVDGRISLRA